MKKKEEKGIEVILNHLGYVWCIYCKLWDKRENFGKHHQHEIPDEQPTN